MVKDKKRADFDMIRAGFDAIGDRFEGKSLGLNGISPLES